MLGSLSFENAPIFLRGRPPVCNQCTDRINAMPMGYPISGETFVRKHAKLVAQPLVYGKRPQQAAIAR